MKKFFSLVLALVMALSLTTVAWGVVCTDDPCTAHKAAFDGEHYATLQEAVDAAEDANTVAIVIDLLNDATLDVTAWKTLAIGSDVTTSITINGNNNTLTFNQLNSDWNNIATKNGAKLIINNAKITNSGHNDGPWNRHDLNFACDVELNDVTSGKALAFKAGATLNNVTISDANTRDTYAIWIQPKGQDIVINGLVIDMIACSDGRGIKIDNQYINAADEGQVTLDIKNATFKTEEKAAILVKSTKGADITASNCNISGVAADSTNLVWVDEDSAASANLVTVTGATGIAEGTTGHVAQLNGVKYETLAAAVAAAVDGDTITLLAACAENVTVPVITLDPNGYAYTGKLTPPANYQVLKNTDGTYVVVPAVTSGDKYDLYIANAGMKDALAAGAETIPALSFNEKPAKTNQDGSGNIAYIEASNGEYFVKTMNPTVADYAVTDSGKTTVKYYVSVVDLFDVEYWATAKAFTNFGTKCGQLFRMDTTKEYYEIEKAEAGLFQKGDVTYFVAPGTVGVTMTNVLVGNEIKTVAATPVDDTNTVLTPDEILAHKWAVTGVKAKTDGTTKVTEIKCLNCPVVITKVYDEKDDLPAGSIPQSVTYNGTAVWFALPVAGTSATVVGTTGGTVNSADTFDAGIAMYVGMSVMAAAGSAVVIGKKKD